MYQDLPLNQILIGDCRELLKTLPDASVHCVVTSPPYWGLRSYQTEPQVWQNGHEPCIEHQWVTESIETGRRDFDTLPRPKGGHNKDAAIVSTNRDTCSICGAWRGELGLEPTPEMYVAHLVEIFRECRRVLRDDGTLWLNLGDSYAGSWGASGHRPELDGGEGVQREKRTEYFDRPGYHEHRSAPPTSRRLPGLKPKDLVGIPWMVAFALRADGWYLRSDIIWAKPNPMPESVTDRPTKAHEYIFLLSKSQKYYYDTDAVREQATTDNREYFRGNDKYTGGNSFDNSNQKPASGRGHVSNTSGYRNRRTVWTVDDERALLEWLTENYPDTAQAFFSMQHERKDVWQIATHPFKGAHFATFPPKLIEPCILAGCPVDGVVLDPFMGSGTTASVCISLKRHYIGFDLNPAYVEDIAQDRADNTPPPLFVM